MIQLALTIVEVNQILSALGQCPYEDVFQLINNIQQQAQTQLQNDVPTAESKIENEQPKGR